MKTLLLVGGVLFLLLALVLFAAAVVVFLIGRSRRAKAAVPSQRPQAPTAPPPPPRGITPSVPPPMPAPAVAAPPPPPVADDPDGTIVLNTRGGAGALHGVAGALAGRSFPIDAVGFYIGRDRTQSQVVIENPSVSKRHVWVGMRDGAVVAVDQQSTNGTYLNDPARRIGEVRLAPGDTLIISDDVARLEYRA